MRKKINRRDFLKVIGVSATASTLASCSLPPAPPAEDTKPSTQPPQAAIETPAAVEPTKAIGVSVLPSEMQQKDQWVNEYLLDPQAKMPFSFIYGDQSSEKLLAEWPRKLESRQLDAARTEHTLTWADTSTSLEVKCVAVEYSDYPVVEWTVYLRNTGGQDTPILSLIRGLDTRLERGDAGEFVLNGIKGDWCTADSYEPYRVTLGPNASRAFAPQNNSGKSSDGPDGWPYYNLQTPEGGMILAVGWPGQWESLFSRDASTGLDIQAGQKFAKLLLHPGEKIRTPLIAILFWRGTDTVRAQNIWRRWYIAHTIPRVKGEPPTPLAQIQVSGNDTDYVNSFLQAGITPDLCWRDAAWYPNNNSPYTGNDAWINTGTWEVDPAKYPDGFEPFSDWIHARGMKFVLWFEPERVGDPNSWLGQNHPEWLLKPGSAGLILDEGNPAAFDWLVNHLDNLIKTNGVDWYREDMNGGGPGPTWVNNDAENRLGITENFYVQGHLALWDALVYRNPGLRIDSCASGGRRNDLETMRRAVPLLRSDFQFPSMEFVKEGNQGHTYGLSSWLPFQGSGVYFFDSYAFRSFYMASFGMVGLSPENTAAQQQAYAECRKIAPCLLFGDYYPLTPYSLQLDQWIAWQFDRPEEGEGVIQAFRRENCEESTSTFRLSGLDPAAQYELTDFDIEGATRLSGKDLTDKGLTVAIKDKPGAAVIAYKRTE